MMFRRARSRLSELATYEGTQAVALAANISSRALVFSSKRVSNSTSKFESF